MSYLNEKLDEFCKELQLEERAKSTLASYRTDIIQYIKFLKEREPDKENTIEYKKSLIKLATSTQNRKLIAINKFLRFIEKDTSAVKVIKVQKANTIEDAMNRNDYIRCLRYARILGKEKYWYIMKTLAGTGIRISELPYITIEAVKAGKASVWNKGKKRIVPIHKELCKLLKAYAKSNGILEGCIFITSTGKAISRSQIHKELKLIAGKARVKKSKIHAHAFRHLFAFSFLDAGNNIADLADILGHSSLETTRIYVRSTTKTKADKMGALGL